MTRLNVRNFTGKISVPRLRRAESLITTPNRAGVAVSYLSADAVRRLMAEQFQHRGEG